MSAVAGWPGTVPGEPWTVDHYRRWAEQLVFEDNCRHEVEPWQREIVKDLFAGYEEVWMVVPEGNSKTTMLSAIGLYHLDQTRWPWVPVAASSRDQAEILFGQARGYIERTPICTCEPVEVEGYHCVRCGAPTLEWEKWENPEAPFRFAGTRQIKHTYNGGHGLKVYASDVDTADGVILTLGLVDEGHRHKNLDLYRTWVGKCEKRQGQVMMISTAGEPGGDFEKTRDAMRQQATDVKRKGKCFGRFVTRTSVLHEYAIPSPAHARDVDLVKAANPLRKISKQSLRDKMNRPSLDWGEDWLRKVCNVPARSSLAAISEINWERAGRAYPGDPEAAVAGRVLRLPKGVPVLLGADFAWVQDCLALVPLWLHSATFRLVGQARVIEPPRDGTMIDPYTVRDAFERIHERNPIIAIVADSTKAQDTLLWAGEQFGCPIVDRTQANAHAVEDYNAMMEALRGGVPKDFEGTYPPPWFRHDHDATTLVHGDQGWVSGPALRTHAMNAIARHIGGDRYRFDRATTNRSKTEADTRVIDALQAMAMVNRTAGAGWEEPQATPMFAAVSRR